MKVAAIALLTMGVLAGGAVPVPTEMARAQEAVREYQRTGSRPDLIRALNEISEISLDRFTPGFLELRWKCLEIWIDVLNRIDATEIPKLGDWDPVAARAPLLEKLSFYFSGMSLDGIKDPEVREGLKKIAAEEGRRNEVIRWRTLLRSFHRDALREIEDLVSDSFGDERARANGVLATRIHSETSREELAESIRKHGGHP